jgi:hypothetical protein
MAQEPRKYAALPDLVRSRQFAFAYWQDTAPDVYETPELTDDVSTQQV